MGLNIFDRVGIAIACMQGDKQFKKEIREYDRAAGKKKDKQDATPDSDNTTAKSKTHETGKKNKNKADSVKKTPKEKNGGENISNDAPRTEQQICAEAESPAEQPGAEKITAESDTSTQVDAAMNGKTRIEDTAPGVLNFDSFGVSIDLNKASAPDHSAQQVPYQQPQVIANPLAINPAMQFNLNSMPSTMNSYGQMLNTQQTTGYGRHRVDMPAPVKPPKAPKAEPDSVDVDLPDLTEGMEITNFSKKDVRTIGVLEDKVSKNVEKTPMTSTFPNNENLFSKYPYLQDVEKIALDNGYQIAFNIRTTELIECIVCNSNSQPVPNKGFVIDPGFIIDRRKKIFVGLYNFYEGMNAYPLFINGDFKDGKKTSNVLNAELIKNLIVGGNQIIEGVKGMYSEDFRNLNCIVALITIPTHKIGPTDRKYIQNRLVTLYKEGIFNDILSTNPGARFRVADFDKNTNTIILDCDRVPKTFGGQCYSNERIQVKITNDKCKVLRGESLIEVPDEL